MTMKDGVKTTSFTISVVEDGGWAKLKMCSHSENLDVLGHTHYSEWKGRMKLADFKALEAQPDWQEKVRLELAYSWEMIKIDLLRDGKLYAQRLEGSKETNLV